MKEFDRAPFADEAALQPSAGAKVGALTWQPMAARLDDRWEFGRASAPVDEPRAER